MMLITTIFLSSRKTIKSYCHDTDLKNKTGALNLHSGLHVINLNALVYFVALSRHLQSSRVSMRNNAYLLTLQAKCATI